MGVLTCGVGSPWVETLEKNKKIKNKYYSHSQGFVVSNVDSHQGYCGPVGVLCQKSNGLIWQMSG